MTQETTGAVVLRFPVERRLAAISAERDAEKLAHRPAEIAAAYAAARAGVGSLQFLIANEPPSADYVFDAGFFGVRLRPEVGSGS